MKEIVVFRSFFFTPSGDRMKSMEQQRSKEPLGIKESRITKTAGSAPALSNILLCVSVQKATRVYQTDCLPIALT